MLKHLTQFRNITWAHSVSRTASRTGLFLKKQMWVWPIVAGVLLITIAFLVRGAVESTMKANLQSGLETLRDVESEMLINWMHVQESTVLALANDEHVRGAVQQLVEIEPETKLKPDEVRKVNSLLRKELNPSLIAHSFTTYMVLSRDGTILASPFEELVGKVGYIHDDTISRRVFDQQTVITPPFICQVPVGDRNGRLQMNLPSIFIYAPIRDANFQPIAILAVRVRPEDEFTRILQLGRIGESGETYAINRDGTFVSSSRFDRQLFLLGVLPDTVPDSHSLLTLENRDPGGDLSKGFRPTQRRGDQALTWSAKEVVAGETASNIDGYRDYRGVNVVGSVRWLPEFNIGIITEMDSAEALRPLVILRQTMWGLYALLGLASIAIFIFTIIVARLRRQARNAAVEAKQLGQYALEEKLGSGGMGVVYKGRHAMLRRPTAIKLLNTEKTNDSSIARFEREVQITCQLNNPNTVAIYDYGRTPEGVFYYAMEYLDGIDLQRLVDTNGPQPEGRVIHILRQACGSLYEAHLQGLVHRDIKPANIMVNERGGVADFVKVLDFGLVKAVDEGRKNNLSGQTGLTGTPLYLSPEAIQTPNAVDPRSDIYALGAVGYFLLTGHPVFQSESLVELCRMHLTATPVTPSVRLGREVLAELEDAILSCLEKPPGKRPQTARELATRLEKLAELRPWSTEDAEAWWIRHQRVTAGHNGTGATGTSQAGRSQFGRSAPGSAHASRPPSRVEQTIIGATDDSDLD